MKNTNHDSYHLKKCDYLNECPDCGEDMGKGKYEDGFWKRMFSDSTRVIYECKNGHKYVRTYSGDY